MTEHVETDQEREIREHAPPMPPKTWEAMATREQPSRASFVHHINCNCDSCTYVAPETTPLELYPFIVACCMVATGFINGPLFFWGVW